MTPDPLFASADTLAAPRNERELFVAFTTMSLQGFGGVLPITQRVLVEQRRWLTREQFVEMLSVSQVLPGPNVVNLALMYGDRCFGLRGAFAALAGMLTLPLAIVLALAAVYGRWAHVPVVAGALRGMGAVAAGLVVSTALKLLATVRHNPMGRWLALGFAALTFVSVALLRLPLVCLSASSMSLRTPPNPNTSAIQLPAARLWGGPR